jgi:hypothetical protein
MEPAVEVAGMTEPADLQVVALPIAAQAMVAVMHQQLPVVQVLQTQVVAVEVAVLEMHPAVQAAMA